MTQPDGSGGAGGGAGGSGGPSLPGLPDDAAGRAAEVLDGIREAFAGGLRGVGEALAELLPQLIAASIDVAGGLI